MTSAEDMGGRNECRRLGYRTGDMSEGGMSGGAAVEVGIKERIKAGMMHQL